MNVLRDKKQLIIWFQQALQDGAFDENNSQVFAYPTDAFSLGFCRGRNTGPNSSSGCDNGRPSSKAKNIHFSRA
jgi:hypothetical protein